MFLGSSQLSLKRDKHNIYNRNQAEILLRSNRLHSLLHELQLGYFGQLRFDTFKYDKFNDFYSNKKRI